MARLIPTLTIFAAFGGLVPAVASAQGRVAVLMLAVDGQDAETADGLTEVLIGAVAARGDGVEIIGKEEFQSQLNQGEQRSLECVSNTACLGRVGVQLRVDEVIAGTLRRSDETWAFNLNRIRIDSGEVAGRAFGEVQGDLGELAAALTNALPQLYQAPNSRLRVRVNVIGARVEIDARDAVVYDGDAVELSDLTPGEHEVVVRADGYSHWRRVVNLEPDDDLMLEAGLVPVAPQVESAGLNPLIWVGAALALAGGGVATAFGLLSRQERDVNGTRAEAVAFIDARKRDALIANIGFGTLGAGAILALIGLLVSDFDSTEVQASAAIGTDGAQLVLRGRL